MAPNQFRKASMTTKLHGMLQEADKMWGTWTIGLLFIEEDVGFAALKDVLQDKLLAMPRYKSAYDFERQGFVELDDDEMDMDYHIQIVDEEVSLEFILDDYVGNIYKHLATDSSKPLWQMVYFPRLDDGRALVLSNTHHAIGDGVSLTAVLLSLLDNDGKPMEEEGTALTKTKTKRKKYETFGILNKLAIQISGVFSTLASAFATPDTPSVLMREDVTAVCAQKRLTFTETIPLAAIKEVQVKYRGATVNDVLIGLLTLTLRAYLEEKGETDFDKKTVRASFPISIRDPKKSPFRDGSPNNQLALGLMEFPFDYSRRTDVIYKVKRTIDAVKVSPAPIVQKALGDTLLRILPKDKAAKMFASFGNQTTAMLSNVMGPQHTVYVLGKKVTDLQFGLYSSNGCYFGLISYDGKVSCGINMDGTLDHPKEIAKHWKSEFDALYRETMVFKEEVPRSSTLWKYIDAL